MTFGSKHYSYSEYIEKCQNTLQNVKIHYKQSHCEILLQSKVTVFYFNIKLF